MGVLPLILLAATAIQSQPPETPAKRLKSSAVVRGFIGGESHDSYVIRAVKGKTMMVQISWRREGDNNAGFEITESSSFFSNKELITFGEESKDGTRWTGKIPKTANYYIYVVAHPTARYTLRVSIK